jgi:hypothetical protein
LWWWDFGWYFNIAHWGYHALAPGSYAFFPLWVLLMKATNWGPEWIFAAVVSNIAALFAFAGVAAAAPKERARLTALAIACFPGSFSLAMAYPDSLVLALTAWACALAARERPVAAASLAALAALARPNAFLVAIPLAAIAFRRGRRYWLAVAAPIATTAAVHGWFWADSGRIDAFSHAQVEWPGQTNATTAWHRWASNVFDFVADRPLVASLAVVAVALLVVALRVVPRRHRGYALAGTYAVVAPIVALSAGSTQTRIQAGFICLVLPLVAILWTMGREYRVWAVYATALVALFLATGSVISFGRRALFAFPIFWAISHGPSLLRSRPVLAAGFLLNLAWAGWVLPRFPP